MQTYISTPALIVRHILVMIRKRIVDSAINTLWSRNTEFHVITAKRLLTEVEVIAKRVTL